jgi:hypothetical protein
MDKQVSLIDWLCKVTGHTSAELQELLQSGRQIALSHQRTYFGHLALAIFSIVLLLIWQSVFVESSAPNRQVFAMQAIGWLFLPALCLLFFAGFRLYRLRRRELDDASRRAYETLPAKLQKIWDQFQRGQALCAKQPLIPAAHVPPTPMPPEVFEAPFSFLLLQGNMRDAGLVWFRNWQRGDGKLLVSEADIKAFGPVNPKAIFNTPNEEFAALCKRLIASHPTHSDLRMWLDILAARRQLRHVLNKVGDAAVAESFGVSIATVKDLRTGNHDGLNRILTD